MHITDAIVLVLNALQCLRLSVEIKMHMHDVSNEVTIKTLVS